MSLNKDNSTYKTLREKQQIFCNLPYMLMAVFDQHPAFIVESDSSSNVFDFFFFLKKR